MKAKVSNNKYSVSKVTIWKQLYSSINKTAVHFWFFCVVTKSLAVVAGCGWWGTFSLSINDTNQSRTAHWDLRIETGGHLFKEEMGASFDFWFCRFHCVLYRGYVSSVASAVSPALQLQIADSTIPSGLGLIDCVQTFLGHWRQSTSLSSCQMPLKNHRGLDSDWLVSLNTVLWYSRFRSKSVWDRDFPIISKNWVCRLHGFSQLSTWHHAMQARDGMKNEDLFQTPISD